MRIRINGENREIPSAINLLHLLEKELKLEPLRVAVELNRLIVSREDYKKTIVNENDELEIVHFVGGG